MAILASAASGFGALEYKIEKGWLTTAACPTTQSKANYVVFTGIAWIYNHKDILKCLNRIGT